MFETILTILFGDVRSNFLVRVFVAMNHLCPCPSAETACAAHHWRAAVAITDVALDDDDPDEAAALMLGTGAHETGFRRVTELHGGPAVSYWQLEVPRPQRQAFLDDPVKAARQALRVARTCRGSMRAYATGTCNGGGDAGAAVAAALRRYVLAARLALL